MPKSLREIQLLVLQHRKLLATVLVGLFAWSLLNGAHKGQPVLVAAHSIAAGETVADTDLATAWIDGADLSNYVSSPADVAGRHLLATVPSAAPILRSNLELSDAASDRIAVSLPLEAGAVADYPVGALVHVWAIDDAGVHSVSRNGVVLGAGSASLASPRIALSLPVADEFQAVSATAVRIVVVSRGAAVG